MTRHPRYKLNYNLLHYSFLTSILFMQSGLVLSAMWDWDESDDDDYEDLGGYYSGMSSLQRVSSVSCQCASCQQRHGNCEMLTVHNTSTVLLPALDDAKWKLFQQMMIDKDSLQYLSEKRVINWCKGTYKLYPMKTTGNAIVFVN